MSGFGFQGQVCWFRVQKGMFYVIFSLPLLSFLLGLSCRNSEAHESLRLLLGHPTVNAIAKEVSRTPAQVILRWGLQQERAVGYSESQRVWDWGAFFRPRRPSCASRSS